MLKNYFKIAWRNLLKHRITSFINIGGLAVSMAAAVLVFMWVQNELNFDNFHKDANRIYRIKNYISVDSKTTWIWENSPYILGQEAEKQVPEIEKVTRISPNRFGAVYFNINNKFVPEEKSVYVDNNWFDVFKYEFVKGGVAAFNQDPHSVIITESRAKTYFGNENPIGKIIRMDTTDFQVQGVIKASPANSSFAFEVFLPVASKHVTPKEKENDLSWGNFNYLTFVKLNAKANPLKVAPKLRAIMAHNRKDDKGKLALTALPDIHFESDLQSSSLPHGDKKVVYSFAALGILLLLIACINYVNLTTARASLRAKEVSIKKIVGAARGQLFMQFVAESALLSAIALVLTIAIITIALPAFNAFTERNFSLSSNATYWGTVLGLTLIIAVILNSIYPALLLSSFRPLNALKGTGLMRIKDSSVRKGLVVLQFSFSIFLIIGVITIYRQMQFVRDQNPGYNRSQVMSVTIPFKYIFNSKVTDAQRVSFTQTIKNELQQESAVESVSLTGTTTIQNNTSLSSGGSDWDGRDKGVDPPIAFQSVDVDYNKVVNMNMKAGRWFLSGSKADEHNVILNETAVKELGLRLPAVGQRFVAQGDTGQVIGVVKDFHFRSMHDKIGPMVIRNSNFYSSTCFMKIAPGKQGQVLKHAEKVWKAHFPSEPFVYTFLDEEFNKLYRNDEKASNLISVFAMVAVVISCLGLFGLAAFTAERRGKEIGIRKVLGATVSGIVSLLSREFVVLVMVALVIASPLAWWMMNKWLQNFAYRIDIQWWMFIMAGVIAVLIAFVTVSFQAIKAAIANPVKSLRSE